MKAARLPERFKPCGPLVLVSETGGPIGSYARPVINVTVPLSTLLGLDDHPGVLSGGQPIPADLARHIAADPTSTWYRMLTDPHGRFLELSTTSYQPTAPIWRTTVARDQTCIWPTCRRPATTVDLDHRTPYPAGATSTGNLQALCRRHHTLKHTAGYHVERNPDGSYTWTTRHGSTLHTPATEQPVSSWPHAAACEAPKETPKETRAETPAAASARRWLKTCKERLPPRPGTARQPPAPTTRPTSTSGSTRSPAHSKKPSPRSSPSAADIGGRLWFVVDGHRPVSVRWRRCGRR
jgi:hypothetical protein